ncbi:MAG: dTMP kinase [Proteobacteria bacterium]|nr:dTMP kinase [Pseudomonadota bacterium]
MGFFRGPLLTVALCMLTLGPIAYLVRRSASPTRQARTFAANLLIAASMAGVLLAAHEGLVRFYPILGSKDLALAIDTFNRHACNEVSPDLTILVDCDPRVGLERARRRIEASSGPREERFELEELAFHQRVRAGYLQLAANDSTRFLIISGTDSIEDIFATISTQVLARIPEALRAVC